MTFHPTLDRILVKPDEAPKESPGGILLPDEARERQKPSRGKILAVGPGRVRDDGSTQRVRLSAGQVVYYGSYQGQKIEEDGQEFLVLAEEDVFCVAAP